jgi:hypothetical protein
MMCRKDNKVKTSLKNDINDIIIKIEDIKMNNNTLSTCCMHISGMDKVYVVMFQMKLRQRHAMSS